MSRNSLVASTSAETLAQHMQRQPGAVLERVAESFDVSPLTVAQALANRYCAWAPGTSIAEVLEALASWGEVMFIVHSAGFVVEVATEIPPAIRARGYFNFHGNGIPLGGHLPEDACQHIAFIDRPFMNRRSLSIQCFDAKSAGIFKVFVRRDAQRELLTEQVAAFTELRERVCDLAG